MILRSWEQKQFRHGYFADEVIHGRRIPRYGISGFQYRADDGLAWHITTTCRGRGHANDYWISEGICSWVQSALMPTGILFEITGTANVQAEEWQAIVTLFPGGKTVPELMP